MSAQPQADLIAAAMRYVRLVRRRWRVVAVALAVALSLGAFRYVTADRVYQAEAELLVERSGPEFWKSTSGTDAGQTFLPTYERLLTSGVVLEGALAILEGQNSEVFQRLREIEPQQRPMELAEQVSVRSARLTNLIDLRCNAHSPAAARQLAAALIDSYLAFIEKSHRTVSSEIVEILDQERRSIEQELENKRQQVLEVRRRVKSLGVERSEEVRHPVVERVIQLNQTLVDVQQQRMELQATLTALHDALQRGADLQPFLLKVDAELGRHLLSSSLGINPEMDRIASSVEQRLMEETARLESISAHLGPTHPKTVQLRNSIAQKQQYLADYRNDIRDRIRQMRREALGPMLENTLREKLVTTRAHEQELLDEYTQLEQKAVALNDNMAELVTAENDLQRVRRLHDTLLDRIANLSLGEEAAEVRVTTTRTPIAGVSPVSPKLVLIGLQAVLAGLAIALGTIYVQDLLDDRFRSVDELQQEVGFPVLGVVGTLAEETNAASLASAVHADSLDHEAFRTLRTALVFADQPTGRIAVTSTEPGDGKTTVLTNLGAAFAAAGRRTLMIDADLRRPGLSTRMEMKGPLGLGRVLTDAAPVAEIVGRMVLPTEVQGLDVIPCGPRVRDPAEALAGGRFLDLLLWAEERYDQILVDCPPVLVAGDAMVAGRAVDSVLVVVQPRKNPRRAVRRALDQLRQFATPVIGLVANRIDEQADGFDAYGYGYGYGYRESDSERETVTAQPARAPSAEPGSRNPAAAAAEEIAGQVHQVAAAGAPPKQPHRRRPTRRAA